MAKKKKCPPPGPNMSYMISFGDTMTALLAFFIVLNSMAEEQSGAALHAGTGSFVTATSSFGLPGAFSDGRSKQAFQLTAPAPSYVASDPTGQTEPGPGRGPHDEDDGQRVIDLQKENFHRMLNEIEQNAITKLAPVASIKGEVNFDVLGSLPHSGPIMNKDIEAAVKGVARMLRQPAHEVELTVWCTTPAEKSWKRAIRQAIQVRQETIELLKLSPAQQQKLTAVARPWPWSDLEPNTTGLTDAEIEEMDTKVPRPAMSVTVRVTGLPERL